MADQQAIRSNATRLLFVLLVPLALGVTECNSPQQDRILELVNQTRAQHGLPALAQNPRLALQADVWAERLAELGALSHSNGQGYIWETDPGTGGEIVGYGTSIEQVHQGYLNSPPHLANILNPSFRSAGGGYAEAGGRVYTVVQFHSSTP
ncbi:MAG: CAP domain-containing protein [Polyangiales bacterium]|nr:hypothetical protein [Myxococcales bacterium]